MRPDRFETQVRIVNWSQTVRTLPLHYVQLTSAGRLITVLLTNFVVGYTSLRYGVTWMLVHILFTLVLFQ